MYFKEKEDTNIDSEFESNKKFKFNFDFKNINPKLLLFIGGGIILLLVIIFIVIALLNNSDDYFIEIYGEKEITIGLGDDYIEPGYKAYDGKNKDISNEVKITSNLDHNKVGKYEILYSVGDIDKVRTIIVVEKNQKSYIHLTGDKNMYLKVGEKYVEPGYTVYDSVEDLSKKVIVTGKVDTSKKGTYEITYTVTNSRNVTTTVKRIVVVE